MAIPILEKIDVNGPKDSRAINIGNSSPFSTAN